jgi:hypothetical protein
MGLFERRRPRLKAGETRALPGGGWEHKTPWLGNRREKSPNWDRRSQHGLYGETDPYPFQEGYPNRPFSGVHVQFAQDGNGLVHQIPGGGFPQLFHLLIFIEGCLVRTDGVLTNLPDAEGNPAWLNHQTNRLVSYTCVAGWYSH